MENNHFNNIENNEMLKEELEKEKTQNQLLLKAKEADSIKFKNSLKQKENNYNENMDLLIKYLDTEIDKLINQAVKITAKQYNEEITENGLIARLKGNINFDNNTDIIIDVLKNTSKKKILEKIKELK